MQASILVSSAMPSFPPVAPPHPHLPPQKKVFLILLLYYYLVSTLTPVVSLSLLSHAPSAAHVSDTVPPHSLHIYCCPVASFSFSYYLPNPRQAPLVVCHPVALVSPPPPASSPVHAFQPHDKSCPELFSPILSKDDTLNAIAISIESMAPTSLLNHAKSGLVPLYYHLIAYAMLMK
ncbi:hypothetical protein E2C01_033759 [Portunus trituberculatus]|uniref:Uncharacterized protein n=1 Tax=Portunus trituberculatus TaxID=210409 RepID=A0A5B7F514_PORTR|nr:hypothetical protein [Portunus trituberculatus]